jgi:hypothetical protein
MSRWKLGDARCLTETFSEPSFGRWDRDIGRGGEWRKRALIRPRSLNFRTADIQALCGLFVFCWGMQTSSAKHPDFGIYARAIEYCRGAVKRPMALDLDKRVLCLDGDISSGKDFSLAGALRANGLLVVRSPGGEAPTAITLANMMRDRRATIVVYDYCFSACASFLLVASDEAFVMKDAIVAWHHSSWPGCASLEVSNDGGPKRLEKPPCTDASSEYHQRYRKSKGTIEEFYATRIVDLRFQHPPESFTIRKRLRSMFEGTGRYPDVAWTWNPRYYPGTLKTKITYEAYPDSQAELDVLLSKLPRRVRVLYDP